MYLKIIIIACVAIIASKASAEELQPGDMGYLHGKYHDLYSHLQRRLSGGNIMSCCNGEDCRITLDMKPALPEDREYGIVGRIFVDGMWCPVARDQLVDLPQEVKMRGAYDPHMQDFQNQTHVCASHRLDRFFERSPSRSVPSCPIIYCVKEGGARS